MKEAEAMDNWLEVSEHFMVNKLLVKTSVVLTGKPLQVVILYHFTWQPEKVYLCPQWSREKSKKVLKTYGNVSNYLQPQTSDNIPLQKSKGMNC